LGLKNVEIWGAKPHFLPGIQSAEYLKETAAKLEEAGLKVICFCPEGLLAGSLQVCQGSTWNLLRKVLNKTAVS